MELKDLMNNPVVEEIRGSGRAGAVELTTELLPEWEKLLANFVFRRAGASFYMDHVVAQTLLLDRRDFRIIHRIEPGEPYPNWVTSNDEDPECWASASEACEWYDENQRPRPMFLLGSSPVVASLDAGQLLEDLAEHLLDEAPEDWTESEILGKLNGVEDLKAAIAAFNEANADNAIYYTADRSVRVCLPRRA